MRFGMKTAIVQLAHMPIQEMQFHSNGAAIALVIIKKPVPLHNFSRRMGRENHYARATNGAGYPPGGNQ